jgi:type II secretory pathway pseudopilin PulG
LASASSSVRAEAGLTLIEVSMLMTLTAVLMAALAPTMAATLQDTRTTRAITDMTNISLALNQALGDTGRSRFTIDGSNSASRQVELLVSDGDTPACDATTSTACGNVANSWVRPVDNVGGDTDFLERHLVTNNPRGSSANDYPAGAGGWRGPYLNPPIDADPWGNRYAVNAEQFNRGPNVDVFSAGPDEVAQTRWSGAPLIPSGDDLVVLVQN